MPPKQTPLENFEALLTAYGSQTDRWPEDAQARLDQLLAQEPKAAALFARERRLDDWLDARLPEPSAQVTDRVMQSLKDQLKAQMPRPQGEVVHLSFGRKVSRQASFVGAAMTALAACFVAGFIIAPVIFETLTGAGDPLASLEIISTAFLPTEPL
jgi:anti-sigma factor RsiW